MKQNGCFSVVNRIFDRMKLNRSEKTITSDGNGGWYVRTEISTHNDFDPGKILTEMKQEPEVIDVSVEE